MKIQFVRSQELILTTHAGLATVGALLAHTKLTKRLNHTVIKDCEHPYHSHADVMKSYLGLLCQGKSDFDHIEPFRKDDVFSICMQLKKVPSSPTLRQRMDAAAASEKADWNRILLEESADLLRHIQAPLTGLLAGGESYIPLDLDVSPFDNSGTKKEGVSRTYRGTDGYAPLFAYLGQEGHGINVELREGKTEYVGAIEFAQKGFKSKLRQVFHVIERTMEPDGQLLLVPKIEVHVVLDIIAMCALARY
ncbi:hypothetical protein PALA111701_27745 [Paenibacillus lactis]